ncbi:MAG TPA: energy transducer TonB [Pyrinomonadaceae bacterium]
MCCKNFGKKIVPFALAFTLGLLSANLSPVEQPAIKNPKNVKPIAINLYHEQGRGTASCNGYSGRDETKSGTTLSNRATEKNNVEKMPVKIVSKPQAGYTDTARKNQVQGIVRLRVVFLANGRIGSISPINILPDGLTLEAMAAARQIKFQPATRGGIPFSVTKVVEYNFTIN